MPLYSVYGCWDDRQRFAGSYQAVSPRDAEGQAQGLAREEGGTLWVARVVAGEVAPVDKYTAFVDPLDDRNQDAEGLEPDMPELLGANPDWTVFGLAVPRGTADEDIWRTAERYGDIIAATSPRAAEDVARARLADKGGELWVCTVLGGAVRAVDTYATFADPDVLAVP